MKISIIKLLRLFIGYFLYGLGIVLTVNANQGLAPWSVFHQGLANQLGITMGVATQVVGLVILVLDFIFGERLGWGTVGNVIFIGTFIDLIMLNNWIPIPESIVVSYGMMLVGLVVMALATYSYLSAQLGAGPRDGFMIAMTKRTNLSVGWIRNIIEAVVLIAGYFMGGSVGLGTLVMAVLFGRFIQITFKLFKFDVRQVRHRYIDQDFVLFFNKIKNKKSKE
jgi:uncharacterized membrane protein YczE